MKTVCMFYHLKNGGKPKGVAEDFERLVEELYRYTTLVTDSASNIKDYCEIYLKCPNNGEIDDWGENAGHHLPCGALPAKCYLAMEEVDFGEGKEDESVGEE